MFGSKQRGFLDIVGLGLSVLGFGLQVDAASDAKDAGKEAERKEKLATEESVRRLEKERDDLLGRQKTNAARAGIDVDSRSVLEIASEAMDEYESQIELEKEIGATAARQAGLEADIAAGTALTGALQSLGSAVQYGYNIWGPD